MMKIKIWVRQIYLIFALLSSHVYAAHILTFDDLSLDNRELSGLQGDVIQIRGFWYLPFPEQGVLAAQPKLKSCCLLKSHSIEKQVVVKGVSLSSFPLERAITLEGIFSIQPVHDSKGELTQYFVLEQARQVPQETFDVQWIWVLGIVSAGFFTRLLSKLALVEKIDDF